MSRFHDFDDGELDAMFQACGAIEQQWQAMADRYQEPPRQLPTLAGIVGEMLAEVRFRNKTRPCQWPQGCGELAAEPRDTLQGELWLCPWHLRAADAIIGARLARENGGGTPAPEPDAAA